jgi:oxalate---CoA ligase
MVWATCAPLNPALARDEYELLLRSLGALALIVPQGAGTPAVDAARRLGLHVLRVEPLVRALAGIFELHTEAAHSAVSQVRPVPGDIALVLHTSGTTSRPKAVPLTHTQALARSRTQPIGDSDRCVCVAPLFTSSALAHSLLGPLAAGASIGFTRDTGAQALIEAVDTFGATYFSASPAVHSSLVEVLERGESVIPTTLRFVRSSSSALPMALKRRLEIALGVPVLEGYGITEAGMITQEPFPLRRPKQGSVGTSVGPQVAVMDEAGTFLQPRGIGEVVVRGPGVTNGYENDPVANRAAFLDGWFRTGDIGYLDEDGYLFLTGRLKELINRGGLKVSPAEVDAVLLGHPDVREAATFAVPHPALGDDVAAAVVLREHASVTMQQLRDFAREWLAPYKVPTTILKVTQFPRNALGKVNRGELSTTLSDSLRQPFVPPRDAEEELVAKVFADVLQLDQVGAFDNFFESGGDSLSGMRAVVQVNDAFGTNLVADSLFKWPTVAELSAELKSVGNANPGTPAAPMLPLRSRNRRIGDG